MRIIIVALVFVAVSLLVYQNIDLRMQLATFENNMLTNSEELKTLQARYAQGRNKYNQLKQQYHTLASENRKLKHLMYRAENNDLDDNDYKEIVRRTGFKRSCGSKKRKEGVNVSTRRPICVY